MASAHSELLIKAVWARRMEKMSAEGLIGLGRQEVRHFPGPQEVSDRSVKEFDVAVPELEEPLWSCRSNVLRIASAATAASSRRAGEWP